MPTANQPRDAEEVFLEQHYSSILRWRQHNRIWAETPQSHWEVKRVRLFVLGRILYRLSRLSCVGLLRLTRHLGTIVSTRRLRPFGYSRFDAMTPMEGLK